MRTDRGWKRFYAAGWLVSAVFSAAAFHQWHAHLREVEERAAATAAGAREAALRRVMEERLHIARELHDSLTHSISVIKIQAGVAAHLARKRGEEPSAALEAIEEASADAVRELRSTLDVLRGDDTDYVVGLARVPTLVARTRAAGLPTSLTIEGRPRDVPPEVDRAAYRVVQEALTNVSRHAGKATATVRVRFSPEAVTVRVEDDGGGPEGAVRPGHGLVGMSERVAALGGRLNAGPRGPRGFCVQAELPLAAAP